MPAPRPAAAPPEPLIRAELIAVDDHHAAVVQAPFSTSIEHMRQALPRMDRFGEHIPLIQKGTARATGERAWDCSLSGKLGIWKLGVAIDMAFAMAQVDDDEFVLTRYYGGTFPRLFFRHRLRATGPRRGVLESHYFFDMEGFSLLGKISAFKRHPWLSDELQVAAASMMVRGCVRMAEATAPRA